MEPSLPDGSTVLVKLGAGADVGDVVLIRHPTDDGLRILKRVDHLTTDGHLFLKGDAGTSTDSWDFGPVPPDRLLGTVTCTLP
jgi:nickel-type superoxide dismutase maturation protease